MTEATIDLRRYGDSCASRIDSRVRTGMITMLGAAVGIVAVVVLVALGGLDPHIVAVRLLADATVLLSLVAYMSLSTRSAVAELRQQIVGDIVAQVSAVVASRVAKTFEGEVGRGREDAIVGARLAQLAEQQDALTKELARQRGQLNLGMHELSEAVERVECFVKADVEVAYNLGKQSASS